MSKFRMVGLALLTALTLMGGRFAQAGETVSPAEIDHLIRAEWKKEKVVPAPPTDDARYLRRVYLDITGTLPTADEVRAFLASKSPTRRADAVNKLLDSPRYVEHWTNYWEGVLMGKQFKPNRFVDKTAFRDWLTGQVKANTPYNKFVYDLLTATGQNSAGGPLSKLVGLKNPPRLMQNQQPGMEMEMDTANAGGVSNAKINGAVNWVLKYRDTPADLSGNASKIFLGVQIQCAQCHDHKTEKWKQEDFRRFTACFMQARPVPVEKYDPKSKMMPMVELRDVQVPARLRQRMAKNPKLQVKLEGRREYEQAIPAALDGSDFSDEPNRRAALAKWITADENPYFSKAIVNRMWAAFVGRGFVDPIDDFRETNPVVMPALLTKLAESFETDGYDVKKLIRTICATQVYQLASVPAKQTDTKNTLWARYRLKPMNLDVMLNSLAEATNMPEPLRQNLPTIKFAMERSLKFPFDVDEEFDQKEYVGTIPEALLMLNGQLVNGATAPLPGTTMNDVLKMEGDDRAKIEELYLRTLSRKPMPVEVAYWQDFVNAPREIVQTTPQAAPNPMAARRKMDPNMTPKDRQQMRRQFGRGNGGPGLFDKMQGVRNPGFKPTPKQQAYEDMFWALLNSSEFLFNH